MADQNIVFPGGYTGRIVDISSSLGMPAGSVYAPIVTLSSTIDVNAAPVNVTLVTPGDDTPAPQRLLVDDITGALATIPVVHHEVHEGETFQASWKSVDPADGGANIADNANIQFVMETGDLYCHLVWEIDFGGDAEVAFYEGATFTGGILVPTPNMKRYSPNVSTVTVHRAPATTPTLGTLLHNRLIPGGTGGNSQGGQPRKNTEWILDLNTTYLLRGINRAGNAQPGSVIIEWYEESTA